MDPSFTTGVNRISAEQLGTRDSIVMKIKFPFSLKAGIPVPTTRWITGSFCQKEPCIPKTEVISMKEESEEAWIERAVERR
jgi:hypothetical protein